MDNNIRGVYRVAFIRRCARRSLAQRGFVGVFSFFAMPADHFSAYLDAYQPLVLLLITGHFDAVCFHASTMPEKWSLRQ